VEDDDELEDDLQAEFARGVAVVLDYLWGRTARTALIAAAKAGPAGTPMRFVSIGSVTGPEIELPSAVLRSSAIELVGSGLGSLPPDRLRACISELLEATMPAQLRVATNAVPLSQIATVWSGHSDRRRVVLVPSSSSN